MGNVWKTWHDNKFDNSIYLYHYTTVEKACKILYYGNLRFSLLTKTNDTTESKIKFDFINDGTVKDFSEKCTRIQDYVQTQSEHLQLLCFSQDIEKKNDLVVYEKTDDRFFVDMSGRGYALPRMWAQYAENNGGVCLVINKSLFEYEMDHSFGFVKIKCDKVEYRDVFAIRHLDSLILEDFSNSIEKDGNTAVNGYNFLKRNDEFVKYAYFTKYADWKSENEYRYMIGSDNSVLKEIGNLHNYLDGVVVGEKIDSVNEWEIKSLVNQLNKKREKNLDIIRVKKMCFDPFCNRIMDVDDELGG